MSPYKLTAGIIAVVTAVATASAATNAATVPPRNAPTRAGAGVHLFPSHLSPAQLKAYSANADRRVIVLLRNQFRDQLNGGAGQLTRRAVTLESAQQPLLREFSALHARGVKSYSFINAVSARVSAAEVTRLKRDPAVRAVVPDSRVYLDRDASGAGRSPHPGRSLAAPRVNRTPGICGTAKKPLLQPEALKQISAAAPHHGITGRGVRIAVFPDGLDPTIKDFIRPNGSHAIVDYRDFSGDGPNGVTSGEEAFGDASSIISQGRQTFDLSKEVNPALPLPRHCEIRIKGVAPGASLAVMKVFGGSDFTFDSTILQGLDWAVGHDHVDVLSESFGGNPVPDPGTDPVSIFDSEAVAHGVAVVASTGDAGTTNTIGSPASSARGVIGTAASTGFQINAQLSQHGYQLGGDKGWESNNISAISSSGFTEEGSTVDVTAPGDGGWADCSTDTATFLDCANSFGGTNPPAIEDFGGTSESCPLTAGVVALIIQAYRQAHDGHGPSPAIIKRILKSTATDLGAPADEQGAGQVNARRAVALARSYQTAHHAPRLSGSTLAIGTSEIRRTDAPGRTHHAAVTVVNEGTARRTLTPTLRRFGATRTILDHTVDYDPTSSSTPTYTYWLDGEPEPYVEQDFTVPAGYQRLTARLGYPADPSDASQTVSEVLFDPAGRVAADSEPQGAPLGFGQVEVRHPMAGRWRAIYFSRPAADRYSGPIATTVTVQKLDTVAHAVSPRAATLAPGASKTFTVAYQTPARPGDSAAAVSFGKGTGVVPVLTRSTVRPSPGHAGSFAGELTGGNGRMTFPGQLLSYKFDVPAGMKNVDVDVRVGDPGYHVVAVLSDPEHSPVDAQDTTFVDATQVDGAGNSPSTNDQTLHLSWRTPTPGRWSLDLGTLSGSSSGKTASTISGTVAFNTVRTSTRNVPHSAARILEPGSTTTARITVTNTGDAPEIYYVDPRLAGTSQYSLAFLSNPNGGLPVSDVPQALVPPATSALTMVAHATKPVNFAMSPAFGSPEIASTSGRTAVAGYSAQDVPASEWACAPTVIGPFAKPTGAGQFSCAAFASTRTINDSVAATGGNLWDNATDPASANVWDPSQSQVVQPGASTTLRVHITPTEAQEGATLRGYLSVQTLDLVTFSSDDLVHIPYTYTVGTPPPVSKAAPTHRRPVPSGVGTTGSGG